MANLIPLQLPNRIVRDVSRDRLPLGAAWDIVDYIPMEIGAALEKRGGWVYASQDLTGYNSNASDRVVDVIHADFPNPQLLAVVRDDGAQVQRLVQIDSGSSSTDRGSCFFPSSPMVYWREAVWMFSNGVHKYNGSSNIVQVSGAPSAERGCVYKDHLVAARAGSQFQRVFFSEPGAASTSADWNITLSWIDTSAAVTAVFPLRNSILIFHEESLERIIGSIPPPGSDMYLQPVWDVGTVYPWSVAGTDQWVMFANSQGVYKTDGSEVVDVTRAGGMKSVWKVPFTGSGRVIAGGYFNNYYFVTVYDAGPSPFNQPFFTYMIDVNTYRWIRLTNITARAYSTHTGGYGEMYWASMRQPRVCTMSRIFTPGADVKNDGDGTPVQPSWETSYYRLGRSMGRAKDLYVNYEMTESNSDNPTMTVSAVFSPDGTTYTSLSPTLTEASDETDARVHIRKAAFGCAFKFAQTNPSENTRFYGVHIDAHPREPSRLA